MQSTATRMSSAISLTVSLYESRRAFLSVSLLRNLILRNPWPESLALAKVRMLYAHLLSPMTVDRWFSSHSALRS